MSSPSPLQSFIGGLGLSLPVHALLLLNGSAFGIAGFIHRAVVGHTEAVSAVAGLVLGGVAVGKLEGVGPAVSKIGLGPTIISGLLVGAGTKLSNGCTSGHMISGISRFSLRSLAATTTFFITGVVTTHVLFGNSLLPALNTDWSIKSNTKALVTLQVIPLTVAAFIYFSPASTLKPNISSRTETHPEFKFLRRVIVSFVTGFSFAVALHYSNLSNPSKVTSFLILPFHKAFDPSLAYLALGALPLSTLLYHYCIGSKKPRLGGMWDVNDKGKINLRLLLGAAVFGVGWGIAGICPGPGLVNLGRALSTGAEFSNVIAWVGSVAVGGLLMW